MPSIYSIVYRPKDRVYADRQSEYIRVPIDHAELVPGQGIAGDAKGDKHPERELNLMSLEWLQALREKGYKTAPGQMGEQITVSGLAVERLAPGTRLQLGPSAVIEVVKARTGCNRFEAAQGRTMAGLGVLGVMAKVITGGEIAVGDPVFVLNPERVSQS